MAPFKLSKAKFQNKIKIWVSKVQDSDYFRQCDQMKISKSGQKFSETGKISGQLFFAIFWLNNAIFTAFFAVLKHF